MIKHAIPCDPLGEVQCKGVHYPVRVHAPNVAEPDPAAYAASEPVA